MEFFTAAATYFVFHICKPIAYAPFYMVYFHGPAALGFWEGKNQQEICSRLTAVEAQFWDSSLGAVDVCNDLIDRKMNAFFVMFLALLMAYVSFRLTCISMNILEYKLTYYAKNGEKHRG